MALSNKEILEKAFMVAIQNGFRQRAEEPDLFRNPESFIYRHDFAKALWPGDKNVYSAEVINSPVEGEAGFDEYLTLSKYHLQQMVIAEDPIKYLGAHL